MSAGLDTTGLMVAECLRRAADEASSACGYGTLDLELPARVWEPLRKVAGSLPYVLPHHGPEYPWTPISELAPVVVETKLGMLRCWPPGAGLVGSQINMGGRGNPDGDTREG